MLIVAVLGALNVGHAMAAGDGCDSEDNNRIAPELALCSVHAYNIGDVTNPTGANRQLMKDVIALKTTVITQQMNKQYEYMDAMIRRFKTQLEKAVLTTKLQAAGAAASGNNNNTGGGSYSSGGVKVSGNSSVRNDGRATNIYLDDAANCAAKLDTLEMINCLAENYSVIMDATNSGQTITAEATKQLATDFKLLANSGIFADVTKLQPQSNNKYDSKCEQDRNLRQRNGIQTCLTAHSANIRKAKDEYSRQNRQDKK